MSSYVVGQVSVSGCDDASTGGETTFGKAHHVSTCSPRIEGKVSSQWISGLFVRSFETSKSTR